MTERYSEAQMIEAVVRLTPTRLAAYVEAEIVSPVRTEGGLEFRRADVVRLELLCDLTEGFDLEGDALGVVVSLVDQLHRVRGELRAVLAAIEAEPPEVRESIARSLLRQRSGA